MTSNDWIVDVLNRVYPSKNSIRDIHNVPNVLYIKKIVDILKLKSQCITPKSNCRTEAICHRKDNVLLLNVKTSCHSLLLFENTFKDNYLSLWAWYSRGRSGVVWTPITLCCCCCCCSTNCTLLPCVCGRACLLCIYAWMWMSQEMLSHSTLQVISVCARHALILLPSRRSAPQSGVSGS